MPQLTADVAIIGSGFSGSLLAWILARSGWQVVLLDRQRHPRFAIGESSTPVANLLLELLSDEYSLRQLRAISRWGSWQRELPFLRCGQKRGFSYFSHRTGQGFSDTPTHSSSLLVAASSSEELSDTQWMRSDVDHWLCQRAQEAGARLLVPFVLGSLARQEDKHNSGWILRGSLSGHKNLHRNTDICCRYIVDATGGGAACAGQLGLSRRDHDLKVNTGALFGHFSQVKSLCEIFETDSPGSGAAYRNPFSADDAAQHHILQDGWLWMLRFREGITSVGIVKREKGWHESLRTLNLAGNDYARLPESLDNSCKQQLWSRNIERYPTLARMMERAELIAPSFQGEAQLSWIPRISRLWHRAAGPGWVLLPGSAGVVDPLHSTGIAHALSGVRRTARLLLEDASEEQWSAYSEDVVHEIRWIDRIVDCCYRAMQDSFELFAASCSLYFVAAIHSERALAETGEMSQGFLCHHSRELREIVAWMTRSIVTLRRANEKAKPRRELIEQLRSRLEPWNDVGLLDPRARNRIARSSAPSRTHG